MYRTLPPNKSIFLPTPSARRATFKGRMTAKALLISTHALREEGDTSILSIDIPGLYPISTHALREEGDSV